MVAVAVGVVVVVAVAVGVGVGVVVAVVVGVGVGVVVAVAVGVAVGVVVVMHLHHFSPWLDHEAYWRKGNEPDGQAFVFPGVIEVCGTCPEMQFVPHDRRLYTVEVELERRKE